MIQRHTKEKKLTVKNIWYEPGVRKTKKLESAMDNGIQRLARFNECDAAEGLLRQPDIDSGRRG